MHLFAEVGSPILQCNPLDWQAFWDAFQAAVDNSSRLSTVGKFNYFRGQLTGKGICIQGLSPDHRHLQRSNQNITTEIWPTKQNDQFTHASPARPTTTFQQPEMNTFIRKPN